MTITTPNPAADGAVARFRKKPVVIEAEQWFPDRTCKGVHWETRSQDDGEFLVPYLITIHEQRAYLAPGDWILPEPKEGRFYPCKPDIFAATYEPAPTVSAPEAQAAQKGEIKRLPEGVQLTLSVFVVNDNNGLEMRVNISGLTIIPESIVNPLSVDALVAEVSKLGADFSEQGWRPMTRAEIKDYCEREDNGTVGDDDDGFDD